MSKQLAALLNVDEQKLTSYVDRLESASLRPGVDIRLSSEVITSSRNRINQLGIDVGSATPESVYQALLQKLGHDDAVIVSTLGLQQGAFDENVEKIATKIAQLSGRDTCLSITVPGVKKLLKTVPPKKTLRALKFRSLDSVIKRYDPRALYVLACLIENDSWKSQIHAKIRRMDSKDIQWQQVATTVIPREWYLRVRSHIAEAGALLVNEELGVLVLLPVIEVGHAGSTILILGLALQSVGTISSKSLPYRTQALTEGYNAAVPKIASGEHPMLSNVFGIEPNWRMVHELIGSQRAVFADYAVEFETFDLFWEATETKLASIYQAMDFWVGSHFVGVKALDGPVSMHILDVATSLVTGASYQQRYRAHFEGSLWNELQMRYLSEEVVSRALATQLSKFSGTMVL